MIPVHVDYNCRMPRATFSSTRSRCRSRVLCVIWFESRRHTQPHETTGFSGTHSKTGRPNVAVLCEKATRHFTRCHPLARAGGSAGALAAPPAQRGGQAMDRAGAGGSSSVLLGVDGRHLAVAAVEVDPK